MSAERKPRRKMRLDQLLVERGLFASREQARRAVMAGSVEVDGRRGRQGRRRGGDRRAARGRGPREPFVSRAGRKLAAALDHFAVDPAGRVCLDVGASTGGFTDCLLQRGAAARLRARRRLRPARPVAALRSARRGDRGTQRPPSRRRPRFPEPIGLITVDVSFISLAKVVPAVVALPRARRPTAGADQAAVRGAARLGGQGRHPARRGAAPRGDRRAGRDLGRRSGSSSAA